MSQPRLLLALFDRLLADLRRAATALGDSIRTSESIFVAHTNLTHAQQILEELQLALDPDTWDGATALAQVYEYLHERLVTANLTKDATMIEECIDLLRPLTTSWQEAFSLLQAASTPGSTEAPAEPARLEYLA